MQNFDDDHYEMLGRSYRRNKMSVERLRILDNQIFNWAAQFEGRLPKAIVDDDMSYVPHGERRLAIETLIDHLSENDVPVTQAEYDEAKNLFTIMSIPEGRLQLLAQLVK